MTIETDYYQQHNREIAYLNDTRFVDDMHDPKPQLSVKQTGHVTYSEARDRIGSVCGIYKCRAIGGFHGTPMCEKHAWQVFATLEALKDSNDKKDQARAWYDELYRQDVKEAKEHQAALESTWKPQRWIEPGWIYYLLVGGLVKIGYTADLERRMKQYPPHSTLLAVHPGTPKLEREMHHKFLHHLSNGREWFSIGDDLTAHIEDVRLRFTNFTVSDNLDELRTAA